MASTTAAFGLGAQLLVIIAFGLRSLYCISEAVVRCGRLDTFPSFGRLVAQRCTFSCLAVLYIVLPVHFLFEN